MDQELSPVEKLMAIKAEIAQYNSLLTRAWESILENEVTNYPIAIFSTLPIEAGVLLIDRQDAPGPWSVSMSTLEEFSVKGLIEQDKLENFLKVYKDPELHFCAFVISDLGAQFLFIPR
jgi:hypothetical protein